MWSAVAPLWALDVEAKPTDSSVICDFLILCRFPEGVIAIVWAEDLLYPAATQYPCRLQYSTT